MFSQIKLARVMLPAYKAGCDADPKKVAFCWIVDFPLFEWNADEHRWDPSHHLFTSPMPEDIFKPLSKAELRDLVEYLSSLKGEDATAGK